MNKDKSELIQLGIDFIEKNNIWPKEYDMNKKTFGADKEEIIDKFGSISNYYDEILDKIGG